MDRLALQQAGAVFRRAEPGRPAHGTRAPRALRGAVPVPGPVREPLPRKILERHDALREPAAPVRAQFRHLLPQKILGPHVALRDPAAPVLPCPEGRVAEGGAQALTLPADARPEAPLSPPPQRSPALRSRSKPLPVFLLLPF